VASEIIVLQAFWDGIALEMAASQGFPSLILRVLAADLESTAALSYTYVNLARKLLLFGHRLGSCPVHCREC
jgi:hypothetical protein